MTPRITDTGGVGRSLLSIITGLFLVGIVMQISGYDSRAAFGALWGGATGVLSGPASKPDDLAFGAGPWIGHLDRYQLAQSLAKATPLLFTGMAVAVALRAGLFNIGAHGQMILGALSAAVVGRLGLEESAGATGTLSPLLHIPLTLLAGITMGALWGALPGLLKAYRGVHEVITTILLNYLAIHLAGYLVTHNLKDPNTKSMAAQTGLIAESAWLRPLYPNSSLTLGIGLAVIAVTVISFLIRRAALGYEIRAVGLGAEAAQASGGIPVAHVLLKTMMISGGLAGLAGAVEVMGVHHRYFAGVEGNFGFDGIAVALLGGLNGLGVTFSALFFGLLANGARLMQIMTDVPESIAIVVQAVVILFVGVRWQRTQKRAVVAALTDTDERRADNELA
jgi:simple sugar transport system permease protein